MAQYNPSALTGQIKGSIGSTTFQGGNNSSVIRTKTYKKGKSSQSKTKANNLLTQVVTSWRTLTALEKLNWVAGALLWPFINKFGVSYFASPYQFYCAYNLNLLYISQPIVTSPNIPAVPIFTGPFTLTTLDTTDIVFTPTTLLITNQYSLVFATNAVSPGRNDNNAKFTLIKSINMNGFTTIKCYAEYVAIFGIPKVGTKIIFKIVQVLPTYPYQYYSTVISGMVV